MDHPFKVGDKVKCVDAGIKDLRKGKHYDVLSTGYSFGTPTVNLDGARQTHTGGTWFASRFELVKRT